MNEEDFQEVAAYLRKELRACGLGEIADERNYVEDFGDGAVLPSAEVAIIEMLAAFARHLKSRDRGTFEQAMEKIRGSVDGATDARPMVERARINGGDYRSPASFDALPDFRALTEDIFSLIADVKQSRDYPRG